MSSELLVVGLSWRTAPVAVREKLAFREEELPAALAGLLQVPGIGEALILSTCNRVDIYAATAGAGPSISAGAAAGARRFLADSRGVPFDSLAGVIYEHEGEAAVQHAFRVASALDSLVLGEAQILGQHKAAHAAAAGSGALGAVLGRCLERAFGVAKRVRTETAVGRGAANVSTVAVDLAARVFGDLKGKDVLVVGAGKMSALAARHLRASGAADLVVTNRSPQRAQTLAEEIDAVARPWDQLESLLAGADVVISSTAASEPILTPALFKRVTKARRFTPIVIVDIAVPRDADPAIGKLDGVYLFDIDDLERMVAANLADRAREAEAAEKIIAGEVAEFRRWLAAQRVVPTIRSLREHFETVARAELERGLERLARIEDPTERAEHVKRTVELIVNKLLHTPTTALRTSGESVESLVEAANALFHLDEIEKRGKTG
ncbi:MAG TPA: glutamyl-tRNA reductase [Kofleriaceae bacterium]|nr:glutamyl-tRNA reductase [Kofleriaceae bacterium]